MKKFLLWTCNFLFVVLILFALSGREQIQAEGNSPDSILLSTTTSCRDSGLLDDLLPVFTKKNRN